MSRGVIILGMHRSGTSALTGALAAMGVFVGDEPELTRANSENPRGFFERRDARALCDELLYAAAADWWKVSDFSCRAVPRERIDALQPQFAALFERLRSHRLWALKEPRLCLLMPLFRPWLRDDDIVVHMLRHPLAVARSLRRRNGLPIRVGLALWKRYVLDARQSSPDPPTLVVSYEALVAEPEATLQRLVSGIGAAGIGSLDAAAGAETILSGLDRQSAQAAEFWCRPDELSLWRRLLGAGAPGRVDTAELNSTLRRFEARDAERMRRILARPNPPRMAHNRQQALLIERFRECLDESDWRLAAVARSRSWRWTGALRRLVGWRKRGAA